MKLTRKIKNWFNPNTKEYWDNLYLSEIENGKVRQDKSVLRLVPLLENKKTILDFGCGTGGNVKLLSQQVSGKNFYLLDHSTKILEFVKNQYLKENDDQGNSFHYITDLKKIPGTKFDAIISTQVLEHITNYSDVLNSLWELLEENGIMIISVPVKGWFDHNKEHVNKFTVKSMINILSEYSEWVHVSPRTHSKRSGKLITAFFYIIKEANPLK